VALTFDDGPDPVWTPLVLDALASAGAHATFFIVVPRAKRYPSLISRMRERGQDVAFHCSKHFRHDAMTQGDRSRRGVRNHGARSVRYWRTPWGLITPATEEVANKHRLVGWTADTEDWRGGTPEEMLARVSGRISPGAIVLMHDGIGPGARRDGCAATVDLVRPLVALVRSYGLEPAALDELRHPLPDRNPDFQARGVEWENGVRVLFARVICSFKVMSR
jgi:peptidoglycan/xylan/chitin deacetylase (PgdA/CDA1 family)